MKCKIKGNTWVTWVAWPIINQIDTLWLFLLSSSWADHLPQTSCWTWQASSCWDWGNSPWTMHLRRESLSDAPVQPPQILYTGTTFVNRFSDLPRYKCWQHACLSNCFIVWLCLIHFFFRGHLTEPFARHCQSHYQHPILAVFRICCRIRFRSQKTLSKQRQSTFEAHAFLEAFHCENPAGTVLWRTTTVKIPVCQSWIRFHKGLSLARKVLSLADHTRLVFRYFVCTIHWQHCSTAMGRGKGIRLRLNNNRALEIMLSCLSLFQWLCLRDTGYIL